MSEEEKKDYVKGKLILIAEDNGDAYEVDVESLVSASTVSILDRIKKFFGKKPEEKSIKLTPIEFSGGVPALICEALNDMLSGAEWHPKSTFDTSPCTIIGVHPKDYDEGWEPVIVLAVPGGQAAPVTLIDLLYNFTPVLINNKEENLLLN